ncbi:MAG: InlB B-repeat-containing protein [Acholeplasmataceae bacterium]|jgi:uncharacterized repeat protein (TIGR02543 family)
MKIQNKIILLILLFVSLFTISGCVDGEPILTDEQIRENQVIQDFLASNLIFFKAGDNINNVNHDITLLTNLGSYKIHWSSSNNEVIKIENNVGVITPTDTDVSVKLTATIIVREDLFQDIEFNLIVKKVILRVYSRVTLDLNGGSFTNSETVYFIEDGMTLSLDEDPMKEGFTFIRWTLNGEEYDFDSPVHGDITLVAEYEEVKEYKTVTLNPNGGTLPTGSPLTHEVLKGDVFSQVTFTPTKEGYTFKGWYLDGVKYEFNLSVTTDITLVAEYEKIVEVYHTITLNLNGGSLPTGSPLTHQVLNNTIFNTSLTEPDKEGYLFKGWYLNGVLYQFNTPITSSIILIAEYDLKPVDEYFSITLPAGVTADVTDLTRVLFGTDVLLTVTPTVGKDTIVYINNEFFAQDENGLIEVEVTTNLVVTIELVPATISIFNARKMIDQTVTIKGIVTGIIPDGTSNYIYVNDGTAAIIFYSAVHNHLKIGDLISIEGGLVAERFNNVVIYPQDKETVLKSNQPLPAAINAVDVAPGTLDYAGLSLQAQRFNIENLILKENPPTQLGKNFVVADAYGNEVQIRIHKYLTTQVFNEIMAVLDGVEAGDMISLEGAHLGQYKADGKPYIVQFMLSSADEIKLVYQGERHDVIFDKDNSESNEVISVIEGRTIPESARPRPTKSGYKFTGWYYGEVLFDFSQPILESITLKARWEESTDPIDPVDPSNPNNQVVIDNQNDPIVISYYQGINFNNDASSLKTSLSALINKSALGYDAAKSWLLDSDRDIENPNKLRGIYDQKLFNRKWDGAATWNREHVWPQSKLGGAPRGEAHNLRVSGEKINGDRGNLPFNESSTTTGNLGYQFGDCWWPGNIDKGDVARITMYMNLRYGLNVKSNAEIKVLYKWHIEDPVDAFEVQRNNVIYSVQKNRNPFIDHPEIFAKLYQLIGGEIQLANDMREVFLKTNIDYNVNMTSLNITFFNRKTLVI